ncbi:hypothetical protein [Pseudomonas sp. CGJS7]|uniref:hypothetical protein n=1 Tax=Pseudomonas sp. CGJS7 TaxID=3109348 RepID=UPI00300B14B5
MKFIPKRPVILALLAVAGLAATASAFAYALPGPASCAAVGLAGFDTLADGSLVQTGSSAERRQQAMALRKQAQDRIARVYRAPRAQAVVLFLDDPAAFWPRPRNATGSTDFLPGRSCVVIGPQGRNVDVLAHELMHAELADRVGFLTRLRAIPVWFDEGVAMQVDYRAQFAESFDGGDSRFVRELDTGAEFFAFEGGRHTRHYAAAKREVADWLGSDGPRSLYPRLQRLRDGAALDAQAPQAAGRTE